MVTGTLVRVRELWLHHDLTVILEGVNIVDFLFASRLSRDEIKRNVIEVFELRLEQQEAQLGLGRYFDKILRVVNHGILILATSSGIFSPFTLFM